MFIRFTFRVQLSIFCVYLSFPFGFEGGMWGLIVLIPDHCLSTYFKYQDKKDEHSTARINLKR